MLSKKVAVSYAKALFNLSGSLEDIQKRQADVELLANAFKKHSQLMRILSCPEIEVGARLEILEKLFKVKLDPSVKQLMRLLLKKDKLAQLPRLAKEYHRLVVDSLKSIDIEVVSAEPLTEKTKHSLLAKLEDKFQKKVNLIESEDPTLLGGFILLIGNQLLDLSIKGKVMNLKKQLLKVEI